MCLGYILSGIISAFLGWRYVFFLFSIPSLLAAFLILRIIKEPRRDVNQTSAEHRGKIPFSTIFKVKDLWMLYLGGIPGVYAVWMAGTWAPAMFRELGVDSLTFSSLLASLVGISAIPGLIITGYVSDALFKRGLGRKGLVSFEYVLMALFLFLMGWAVRQQWNAPVAALMIFFVGFFAWGPWAAFYALIADIVPDEIRGTCYGLTNSINFIGAIIAPTLTGWVRDVTDSFEWGCYLSAILILAGALLIFSVRPPFRLQPEIPINDPPFSPRKRTRV
jgi:sugar phosphate permease